MDEHKTKLDKEYEMLMQNFTKELDKLRFKHNQDLEKKVTTIAQRYRLTLQWYFIFYSNLP